MPRVFLRHADVTARQEKRRLVPADGCELGRQRRAVVQWGAVHEVPDQQNGERNCW